MGVPIKSQPLALDPQKESESPKTTKLPRDFFGIFNVVYGSMWKLKRKEVLIVVACAIIAAALQAYAPQLLQQMFNGFANNSFGSVAGTAAFHVILLTFALALMGAILFTTIASDLAYYLATQMEDHWRFLVLRKYYDLPISWHDANDSGEVTSRIERGGSAVFTLINDLMGNGFFVDSLTLLFILPLAYLASPTFFWILFVPIPILVVITYFISSKIADQQIKLNKLDKKAVQTLYDGTMNIRTVKTFAKEDHETDLYKDSQTKMHELDYSTERIYDIQSLIYSVADVCARVLLLFFGLLMLQSGQASLGEIVLLLSYEQLVFQPFSRLNFMFTRVRRQSNRVKILFNVIEESDAANAKVRPLTMNVLDDKIEFKNVSFSYGGKENAVKNISFTIPKGSTVALVGRSGSGKTTIASLIAGFYAPTKGTILWDGMDISQTNRSSIAKQVSYVAQDSALFNRSIKSNIAYADEHTNKEEIEMAAMHAHAHEFVIATKRGYQSVVGERGVRLSGGQRQRLALARALLASGSLLILDESTSQLDSESERAIQEAIDKLRGKVTQVIIAHRLSTVLHADKIVVMDKGKAVASGTHKELLESSPIYKKLYNLQFQD